MGLPRERCKFCDRISPIGFNVPHEIWKAAVPPPFYSEPLCLFCFVHFADRMKVPWDLDIQFFPVSRITEETIDEP